MLDNNKEEILFHFYLSERVQHRPQTGSIKVLHVERFFFFFFAYFSCCTQQNRFSQTSNQSHKSEPFISRYKFKIMSFTSNLIFFLIIIDQSKTNVCHEFFFRPCVARYMCAFWKLKKNRKLWKNSHYFSAHLTHASTIQTSSVLT